MIAGRKAGRVPASPPLLAGRGGRSALLPPAASRLTFDGPDDLSADKTVDAIERDDVPLSRSRLRSRPTLSLPGLRRTAGGRRRRLGWATVAVSVAALAVVGACVPLLSGSRGSNVSVAAKVSAPGPERATAAAGPDRIAPEPAPEVTASFLPAAFAAGAGPFATGPETDRAALMRRPEGGPDLAGARSGRRAGPGRAGVTKLVAFDKGPFPYDGTLPGTGQPFLNTEEGENRGHRSARGRVFWEDQTFSDNRSLIHIPKTFDAERPGVMVVFFHGHGATLKRDVEKRQKVPAQVTASGANAVLVAPQFAVDASDSSAGRFWEEGGFARFLDEAAQKLAEQHGDPASIRTFATMPVVLVAYSGGFVPAAWALHTGGAADRVRGVVLLDAIYGELDKFAAWAAASKSRFFVNASTPYTKRGAGELERMLAARDIAVTTELKPSLSRGGVAFLSTTDAPHKDYVTQAWTDNPIADVLSRLPEYRASGSGEPMAALGSRKAVAAIR